MSDSDVHTRLDDRDVAALGTDRAGGVRLRYAISVCLLKSGRALTVPQIVVAIEELGMAIPGRAGKTFSDSLQWEVGKGRSVTVLRGLHRSGFMPRSTAWWLRAR